MNQARQTLLGHSFGGLFALHELLVGRWPGDVVAVSLSLWFGDGALAREAAAAILSLSFLFATARRAWGRLALAAGSLWLALWLVRMAA